jgi:hypothetical protein
LTGKRIRFKPHEVEHFTSLNSPRELDLGIGFCAVARAVRAAQLLMALHDYDAEKLSNLPPEGVATVTGLTMEEFNDAVAMWQATRKKDNSLTFPQVLWLIGQDPSTNVSIQLQSFSQIPESFDRNTVVTQYINTLALCFGVDSREFWPISSGSLGTASESEIQHLKAKGKGSGEIITNVERHINFQLPEDSDFAFDTQDIEEDGVAATTAKMWVDVFLPLFTGKGAGGGSGTFPGGGGGHVPGTEGKPGPRSDEAAPSDAGNPNKAPESDQVITKQQLLRLLADKGVIPDYMVGDDRSFIIDSDTHFKQFIADGHPEDFTSFVMMPNGLLKEKRLPPIVIYERMQVGNEIREKRPELPAQRLIVDAEAVDFHKEWNELKQIEAQIFEEKRNIHGSPLPEVEATRGARVTKKTIEAEMERWRSHPELEKYALTQEEIDARYGK